VSRFTFILRHTINCRADRCEFIKFCAIVRKFNLSYCTRNIKRKLNFLSSPKQKTTLFSDFEQIISEASTPFISKSVPTMTRVEDELEKIISDSLHKAIGLLYKPFDDLQQNTQTANMSVDDQLRRNTMRFSSLMGLRQPPIFSGNFGESLFSEGRDRDIYQQLIFVFLY